MNDLKLAEPPKPDAECPHTHKHLVVESLTVKRPDGKASVAIATYPGATGIWVQSGKGSECVGLVVQDGVGPYLVIYDEKAQGLPLAVCGGQIQLHTKGGVNQVVIPFEDLLAAVRHVVKEKP